jgi:hypothetical protein
MVQNLAGKFRNMDRTRFYFHNTVLVEEEPDPGGVGTPRFGLVVEVGGKRDGSQMEVHAEEKWASIIVNAGETLGEVEKQNTSVAGLSEQSCENQ